MAKKDMLALMAKLLVVYVLWAGCFLAATLRYGAHSDFVVVWLLGTIVVAGVVRFRCLQ